MIGTSDIYPQSSLDWFGSAGNGGEGFRLNTLESNVSNFNRIRDWEFSLSYGSSFASDISGTLYSFSLGKRFENQYFYARYTPGISQKFIFPSGANVIINDSISVLKTHIELSEPAGFGYSFNLMKNLDAGLSIRINRQKVSEDKPVYYSTDTANFIIPETETIELSSWRGDISFRYAPSENFTTNLYSVNLISTENNFLDEENRKYLLREKRKFGISARYNLLKKISAGIGVESDLSASFSASAGFAFGEWNIAFGALVFHDKFQAPAIAGIQPSLAISNNLMSFSISGIKYFSERATAGKLSSLLTDGVNNIFNNQFSNDRLFLNFNLALSFIPEKHVKFIDVEVKKNIYPALSDEYIETPFAVAKVVNLTGKEVTIKPSSKIAGVNNENVQSPFVQAAPHDTVEVPFYTILNPGDFTSRNKEIGNAEFYLTTVNSDYDDIFRRPILINTINSWDGEVGNLKYFVYSDPRFSSEFAKNILNGKKDEIDEVSPELRTFEKVKVIFNSIVRDIQYVSDPRAAVDRVQFPSETLKLKGGDCDDLSVLFGSLLESIGIQTAFVDYKKRDVVNHVNLMVNTNLSPEQSDLITVNDKKIYVRKTSRGEEKIWIIVEMTSLTDFETAWSLGSEYFNDRAITKLGLVNGDVKIVDIY